MKYIVFALFAVSISFVSCSKREGCTDVQAVNYDNDADEDDGSCIYAGCNDPRAINYDPNADIEGPCSYYGSASFDSPISGLDTWNRVLEVYVDNRYAGRIQRPNTNRDSRNCADSFNGLRVSELTPGSHSAFYYDILQTSSTDIDTISKGGTIFFTVEDNMCVRVVMR